MAHWKLQLHSMTSMLLQYLLLPFKDELISHLIGQLLLSTQWNWNSSQKRKIGKVAASSININSSLTQGSNWSSRIHCKHRNPSVNSQSAVAWRKTTTQCTATVAPIGRVHRPPMRALPLTTFWIRRRVLREVPSGVTGHRFASWRKVTC